MGFAMDSVDSIPISSPFKLSQVLDAGGTQSNNPRYARFAFHAAGMKAGPGRAVKGGVKSTMMND